MVAGHEGLIIHMHGYNLLGHHGCKLVYFTFENGSLLIAFTMTLENLVMKPTIVDNILVHVASLQHIEI